MSTVLFCEAEPFRRLVLRKHWPSVPCYPDVRELTTELVLAAVGRPDLVCAGFPCTNISCAGKGEGINGPKSGLWWEAHRLIEGLRPRWVLLENVPALKSRGADAVLGALEALGYACWPFVVGARAVGAPQGGRKLNQGGRKRVWIVARLADSDEIALRVEQQRQPGGWEDAVRHARGAEPGGGSSGGRRAGEARLADADAERREEQPAPRLHEEGQPRDNPAGRHRREGGRLGYPQVCGRGCVAASATGSLEGAPGGSGGAHVWPAHRWERGQREGEEPRTVPAAFGSLDSPTPGLPLKLARRAHRLAIEAVGDTVVPQVVEVVGRAIMEADGQFPQGAEEAT